MDFITSDRALELSRQTLDAPKGYHTTNEIVRACEYMIVVGSPVDKERAESRLDAMMDEAHHGHLSFDDATETAIDTWTERFVGLLAVLALIWIAYKVMI